MEVIITNVLEFINRYLDYVNVYDWEFIFTVVMIIICPITWNLFARWEFHTKIFSTITGDNRMAADIFAYVLIEMGILRNYLFSRCVRHQPQFEINENFELVLLIFACLLIATGFMLDFMAYYRLGIHGIYYADYFGILMKEMVTSFPYNVLSNPLYVGSTLLFFGISLFYKSPAGILLTILARIMYKFASILENPMTDLIYSEENINNSRKLSMEREIKEKSRKKIF